MTTRREFMQVSAAVLAGSTLPAAGEVDLLPLTISEAAKRIAAKQLSPVELTRSTLARIEALNPKVGAFITVTIRDDNGIMLQSGTVPLTALGHTSFNLTDRFPVTAQRRGTVEFQTPAGGGISVLGLRFNPAGAFSTIPVLAK